MAEIKQKRTALDTVKAVANLEDQIKAKTAANEKRKKIWGALSLFISRNGGYLVSPPHVKRLVIEVPQYSELPDKLFDLGYDLTPAGTSTRIVGGAFVPVVAYYFVIPMEK